MTVPSSYHAVKSHLEQVQRDPSRRLDLSLLDRLKLELTENTDRVVPSTLLTQVSQLLPVVQEDPTPLTTLGMKAAANFTFTDLRSIDPPVNLIAGFRASSPPVNLLALSLLGKAGQVASDAAIMAGDSELVTSLIELWLSTSSTAVAQAALDVIWALLEIDLASPLETGEQSNENVGVGQGLVWRRMFTDKGVYGSLFSLCSLADDGPGSLPKRDKTVAQGRLMSLLVKAGRLRWDIISKPQIPEVENRYQCDSLLHFAACRMVDKDDVLMHMTLLGFFHDLLEIDPPGLVARTYVQSASTFSSPALDFLISHKLHSTVLEYYLNDSQLDPVDVTYLTGPIMAYVAQYAELYPNHFLQNPQSLLDRILSRIVSSISIPSQQWAHGSVPSSQLNVLSSLPRVMLVEASKRHLNPVLALPTSPPNKDAFNALAKIFHGPSKPELGDSMQLNSGQTPTDWDKEAAAARVLYFTYLNSRATFWNDVVAAADIMVMKDAALASISFMQAVITANWQPLSREAVSSPSESTRFDLPSENDMGRLSTTTQGLLPSSGVWAVLIPPALTTLLPYLFKQPRSYAEFAGGGAGDAESVVWKIATAKYEALVALHNRLKETGVEEEGFEDIMRTLRQRVNEGPWGPVAPGANRIEAVGL